MPPLDLPANAQLEHIALLDHGGKFCQVFGCNNHRAYSVHPVGNNPATATYVCKDCWPGVKANPASTEMKPPPQAIGRTP